MTTRPDVILKPLLLNTISHGALDYVYAPKMFALRLTAGYGEHLELEPSLKAPLNFLAWVQMWLRLVLGLETEAELSRSLVGTYAVPAISYRQVELEQLNKPPAHNLEVLMRFAPDGAGQGLTLNQYRERFTRLSVLGRVKIYKALMGRTIMWQSRILRALGMINAVMPALCQAPLRPD